ncbi:RSP_2648 family PIN domain-containing protein [Algirhabdus cladophorae]|uniref:RSP_2648 family PIN domain-containing protein n=1 Tax=Algirhabdus cladophorae TaxID=3377108 RepID=UPI003B8479FC
MRALLDACVLYPTVMRELLIEAARAGLYEPCWSERIVEEWARAAAKHGVDGEMAARSEITLLNVAFPRAQYRPSEDLIRRLWLPDPNDTHVLAAAIVSSADTIITMNAKDFPRNILAEEGLKRDDPDYFLLQLALAQPALMQSVVAGVKTTADRLSGSVWDQRALLKKARLPRLAKHLATSGA